MRVRLVVAIDAACAVAIVLSALIASNAQSSGQLAALTAAVLVLTLTLVVHAAYLSSIRRSIAVLARGMRGNE